MAAGGTLKDGERRGLMFVLSSPSGAGKSTLARMLIEKMSRPEHVGLGHHAGEASRRGRRQHYYFIDKPKFDAMVKGNELLEHAPVFDNFYGTPRKAGRRCAVAGRTCCSISTGRAPSSFARKRAPMSSAFSSCRRLRRSGKAVAHPRAGFR
jgi:guanylate kinase